MTSFITELRRRNVLKVAAAYALVSWILIEAGSVLLPTFGAPEWFFKGYTLVIIAGFLLALVFAWVFEWTPEGVRREKDVERSESVKRETGTRMTYGIIGLLAVALTISITLNVTGLRDGGDVADESARGSSIAVLPFESRSTDPENALFADGIHDDLLTALANIGSLKVISRTSVLKYRNPTRNLPEIASELGVDTVLEGAVQRAGENVRINVQLIDAQTDEHIWAKIYDRKLTARNIFEIQSEISAEITGALRQQLTPEEQGRMTSIPTENLEAYSLYTAGRSNVAKRRLDTLQAARQQFEDAIELDPNYSLAYSGLADSILLLMINHNAIAYPEAMQMAGEALDKALALDDRNADAYASLGLLKTTMAEQDKTGPEFAEAEAAFLRATELSPNHAQAYAWFASLKDARHDLDGAIELNRKSLELDPLARISRSNLARLYARQGRNDKALSEWLEGIRIHPEWPANYENVATHLVALGRLDEAYAWSLKSLELNPDPLGVQSMIGVLLQFGEIEQVVDLVSELPGDHPLFPVIDGFAKMIHGDRRAAIDSWEAAIASGFANGTKYLVDPISDSALLLGDFDKSLEYALLRVPDLENPELQVTAENNRFVLRYALSLLQQDALSERAVRLLEEIIGTADAMPRVGIGGHGIRDIQALALLGEPDRALARLRQAFDEGFRGTRVFDNWNLIEDPYLESIRDTDEFRAIVSDIAAAIDVMKRRVEDARASGGFEAIRASTLRSVS